MRLRSRNIQQNDNGADEDRQNNKKSASKIIRPSIMNRFAISGGNYFSASLQSCEMSSYKASYQSFHPLERKGKKIVAMASRAPYNPYQIAWTWPRGSAQQDFKRIIYEQTD